MRHPMLPLLLAAAAPALLPAPALASGAAPSRPGPASPAARQIDRIADLWWQGVLADNPTFASSLGHKGYEGKLGDPGLAAQDRSAARAAALLKQLDAVPLRGLSPEQQANAAILRRMLAGQAQSSRYVQRETGFTSYASWWQSFASLPDNSPFATKTDYRSYLDRLKAYPAYNDASIAVADKGVADGVVQPCVVLGNIAGSISGVIGNDPTGSRLYQPFTRTKPRDLSDADWAAMKAQAKRLIDGPVRAAYARTGQWYRTRYQPHCRQSVGISATPDGAAYYQYRIREETTTDLTADQIHRIGLAEVARIGALMDQVARDAGYASRAAFVDELRRDPKYYARTPGAMLRAAAFQAKTIDGKLPGYFGRLPRLPYGIKPIPAETAEGTTTAYYSSGSPAIGVAGTYYVNTSKLDQRPLYELPALTAHEAVPGHHLQIALQQELTLPEWRREGTGFTAFVEGWALYAESLGEAMGLYDTPARKMGRLSYEMWRACRLVVDTGLHAKGWTKAQAVAFMREHTALSDANIDAEVNRYISWPGQALAYKLGELKIRELRTRAEAALGDRFDLRAFHDVVLGQGAVPLDQLDRQVTGWIARQKAASRG